MGETNYHGNPRETPIFKVFFVPHISRDFSICIFGPMCFGVQGYLVNGMILRSERVVYKRYRKGGFGRVCFLFETGNGMVTRPFQTNKNNMFLDLFSW